MSGATDALAEQTVFAMVAVTTTWVGLRAFLGLYPGYGLDAAEQWRRHFYATVGTLAMVAIFALGFHVGAELSRLLLAVVFLSLFVLTPLVQHLARWGMRRAGLWGKPVVVLSYKGAGASVVDATRGEMGAGATIPSPSSSTGWTRWPRGRRRAGATGELSATSAKPCVCRASTAWTRPSSPCPTPAVSSWSSWSAWPASVFARC